MTILVSESYALKKYELICMIEVHVYESFENTIYLVWWEILNTHHIFFILIIVSSLLYWIEINKLQCSRDTPWLEEAICQIPVSKIPLYWKDRVLYHNIPTYTKHHVKVYLWYNTCVLRKWAIFGGFFSSKF